VIRHSKRIRQLLTFTILLLAIGTSIVGAETARVIISGESQKIPMYEVKETSYISFSDLVSLTGGRLDWETVGHQISFVQDTNRFLFLIDSPYFTRNQQRLNMTFPASYREGRLFLPAETFMPFLDQVARQKIVWEKSSRTVRVHSEYFNVTDMAIAPKANGLLIEIFLTSALAYDIFVTEGNWLNISIRDGRLNAGRIQSRKDSRYMYRLKTHQSVETGTGQISMRLKRKIDKWTHKIVDDPPRIQISIPDLNFELSAEDTSPQIGPDNKIDVIVIDPGHGGTHYGAVGPKGTREKHVALDIARELAKLIRKDKQFKVIMTRDRDETIDLEERAEIANRSSCDLFISIHANSATKSHIRGWNVFFLAQALNDSARAVAQFENSAFLRDRNALNAHREVSDDASLNDPVMGILNEMIMTEFQAESHDFAMMVDREFRRNLKIPARGVDQAGFFVLNRVFAPSVLIEAGFISNKTEEKLLKNKKFHKSVAKSIYSAIKRFKAKYESQ